MSFLAAKKDEDDVKIILGVVPLDDEEQEER